MQLSIVIINFNVKYFLEHCLFSVLKACKGLDAEVLVVDNGSSDDSKKYLEKKFPSVQFYWNAENIGFAKANNFALSNVKGVHVLFLNPDTIVPEDCFEKCLHFFEKHADCGSLGVRMIDGSGQFLKESKRGLPTPVAGFFKMTKLAERFPKVKMFSGYYASHLQEKENNIVDVLAGAFMMVSKQVIDKTNGFDEDFFMYGEDIDLSYRIQKLGFVNYYFGEMSIIHFKGESTQKKSSVYIKHFYGAIKLFIDKHYAQNKLRYYLMATVIFLGKSLATVKNIFSKAEKISSQCSTKINTLVLGNEKEKDKILLLLTNTNYVCTNSFLATENTNANEIISAMQSANFNAAVFCESTISNKTIMSLLGQVPKDCLALFYANGADSIIGSNNKNTRGIFITTK
jgi:GT2 family glycosyltransferase